MDAIKSFFRKYDAVPATRSGPSWSQATDEALWGWHRTYRALAVRGLHRIGDDVPTYTPATAADRAAALPIHNEIRAEIARRGTRDGRDASPEVAAMHLTEFGTMPGY